MGIEKVLSAWRHCSCVPAVVRKDSLSAVSMAVEVGDADIVRLLIKNGGLVNGVSSHGVTPLMRAAKGGDLDIVKLLLDAGADPLAQDELGGNALLRARGTHGGEAIVKEIENRTSVPVGGADGDRLQSERAAPPRPRN